MAGNDNTKGRLRFAPLIRVSTEAQERRGESLAIQTEQIQKWVKELGGTVPKAVEKRYTAQEHSTPDAERKILDRLLEDATKGLFDAIIVADVSRWARDNLKSEQGLRILKDCGVRFYVGGMEFDLQNPLHKFMLTQNVTMAELYAMVMAERSVRSKIKKAQEGKAGVGKLPHGRLFDKLTGKWSVDPEKQATVARAADLFLTGSTVEAIQEETGLGERQLYKLFNGGAGDEWKITFRPKLFPRLAQSVTVRVPPLLPKEKLVALGKKLARGRALYHANRHRKQHLLNGVLFCGHCGYSLPGAAIGAKAHEYYIHPRMSGKHKIGCHHFAQAHAQPLERAVMDQLFYEFGDTKRRHELLLSAIPKGAKALQAKLARLEKELKDVEGAQRRLVTAVEKDTLPESKVKARMDSLLEQEARLKDEAGSLRAELALIPTETELSGMKRSLKEQMEHDWFGTKAHYEAMSYEEKRDLLRFLFGAAERPPCGAKQRGQKQTKFVKHGIYLKKVPGGGWSYEIKGAFPLIRGEVSDDSQLNFPDPLF